MGEILRIQKSNPSINLKLDKDILTMFASDFKYKDIFESKYDLNGVMNVLYNHYDDVLRSLGGTSLSSDEQLLFSTALQEKILMGSVLENANK